MNCVIFFIRKLYFDNFLDFIWTWIFNFSNYFGQWLDLDCVLKIQDWIMIAKYDSPLISAPNAAFCPPLISGQSSDARLFCNNKQVNLKIKPKIGNLTEKQAQHPLAGKFNKTKNQQGN